MREAKACAPQPPARLTDQGRPASLHHERPRRRVLIPPYRSEAPTDLAELPPVPIEIQTDQRYCEQTSAARDWQSPSREPSRAEPSADNRCRRRARTCPRERRNDRTFPSTAH